MKRKFLLSLFALLTSVTAGATDFITDVKVIGGPTLDNDVNPLWYDMVANGWTGVSYNLNRDAGGDFIYLLYKTGSDQVNANYSRFITDIYIKHGDENVNSTLVHNGRTYYLAPYEGGSHFEEQKGDLNSNAGGHSIHIYYTTDAFSDYHAITSIYFNETQSGAVGENGDNSSGYDLNAGCGENTPYIYMHLTTATAKPFSGDGSADSPFQIGSDAEWERFGACLNAGGYYADKCYKLTGNISASTMVGTNVHPFCGTLDGDGKTLSVNISSSDQGAAPFNCISGATIKRLNVGGSVTGNNYHSAGLVGIICGGTNTISGCSVMTNVNGTGYVGGIVGHGGSNTLTIENSFYGGTISGFNEFAGGLLGWCGDITLTMNNCLFKGSFTPSGNGLYHPIACKYGPNTPTANFADIYYLNTITATATGDNIIEGSAGLPVSPYCIDGSWDYPLTCPDGLTYFRLPSGKRLPYYYGFENQDLNAEGWTTKGINNANPSPEIAHKGLNDDGEYSLFIRGRLYTQYLISPELDDRSPIAVTLSHYLTVDNKKENQEASFQIGYSTKTNNVEDFVWDFELVAKQNTTQQGRIVVPKGTKYVAIKYWNGNYPWILFDIYLDGFCFTACNNPSPTCMGVSDIELHSTKISWQAPESNNTITGYAYQYKRSSDRDWSSEYQTASTEATITGLDYNTDYNFHVKAIYPNEESDYNHVNFTTAMATPYEYDFEDGLQRWTLVTPQQGYATDKTGVTRDFHYNGYWCFHFRSSGISEYLISPPFGSTPGLKFSFYYSSKGDASTSFKVGYSTKSNNPDDFVWVDEVSCKYREWRLYEKSFAVEGVRYVAIKYLNNYDDGCDHTVLIDNSCIDLYSPLAMPTDLFVKDIAPESATITWTAATGATGYAYQYRPLGNGPWTQLASVDGTSVTLTNLQPDAAYEFRLRALHGDKLSNYVFVRFTAENTPVEMPYFVGFENGMYGWRIMSEHSDLTGMNTYEHHRGNFSWRVFQSLYEDQITVSPLLSCSSDALEVSFYHKTSVDLPGYFLVGYSTTTRDISAFLMSTSPISCVKEWNKYSQVFPAGTKYILIMVPRNNSDLYFDDFQFSTPTTLPNSLSASTIDRKATLSWKGGAFKYNLRWRKANSSDNWTSSVVEGLSVELTDLAPSTQYEFQVQGFGESNNYSEWSDIATFTSSDYPTITLADNADNTEVINSLNGRFCLTGTLSGRTLYKNGCWNTLCLPFEVSTTSGLLSGDGVQAMTLDADHSGLANGTLTLNFTAATTIPAGNPFIIKWNNTGNHLTNPVFENITVSKTTPTTIKFQNGSFIGSYLPVTLQKDDKSKLFLGAGNKLYYPNDDMTVGSCRAYFHLTPPAPEPDPDDDYWRILVKEIILNFGDEDNATSLNEELRMKNEEFAPADGWYTLDGQKLEKQPTAKGIYIHNGKKVLK